jgi:hypothetical protein
LFAKNKYSSDINYLCFKEFEASAALTLNEIEMAIINRDVFEASTDRIKRTFLE